MGEYLKGVKIGTCNYMYWITHDELENHKGERLDYSDSKVDDDFFRVGFKYRFPFPEEKDMDISKYNDRKFRKGYEVNLAKIKDEWWDNFKENLCHCMISAQVDSVMNDYTQSVLLPCPSSYEFKVKYRDKRDWELFPIVVRFEILVKDGEEVKLKTLFECGYCETGFTLKDTELEKFRELFILKFGKEVGDLLK